MRRDSRRRPACGTAILVILLVVGIPQAPGAAAVSATCQLPAAPTCLPASALRPLSGIYADKALWAQLPQARNRGATRPGAINALYVDKAGHVSLAQTGWHEGDSAPCACLQAHGSDLTLRQLQQPLPNGNLGAGGNKGSWVGSFVRISSDPASLADSADVEARLYFNRLFGTQRYRSADGTTWRFGDGAISIGGTRHTARLQMDLSEAPTYGSPVVIDDNTGEFWVFVPAGEGWKVFRSGWASDESYVEVDPATAKPWQVLRP